MSTVVLHSERGRELLSQRIHEILESWPERYRVVFVRSHYWGDTAETLAASMHMAPADVSRMLERCDQLLLAALRPFREETGESAHEEAGIPARHRYC